MTGAPTLAPASDQGTLCSDADAKAEVNISDLFDTLESTSSLL
jgi:hypothetical protein